MKPYRLTVAAENDIFDIWTYIASDNLPAADRVESDILRACEMVAQRPDVGHVRRDLTNKPVRFYTVRGTYLVVYDPASVPTAIVRILHGARDAADELG
jgi:plasmid stabilization system protein ParE